MATAQEQERQKWQPFPAFNFVVEILREDKSAPLAGGAFSECDGIEMSQEVKSLREGGNSSRVHRLSGPVAFGQLALKRGVTQGFDLWDWFSTSLENPWLRAGVTVSVLRHDGRTEWGRFVLSRCLPVKLKAPTLNARDGTVAVEEMQIAYESFRWEDKSHD
ncbi:phage tail protein [Derxia lacustris]|uniref:phage tail protein n=1 Tax=Derxia lacustris TaxID=764842 RepID=UPI000A1767A1|nr:phage tail protein [Derxia lacustris]